MTLLKKIICEYVLLKATPSLHAIVIRRGVEMGVEVGVVLSLLAFDEA